MAKLAQINERPVLGRGGTVSWYLAVEDSGPYHLVQIHDADGNQLHSWTTTDGAAAANAYAHPFADRQTPDVFSRAHVDADDPQNFTKS